MRLASMIIAAACAAAPIAVLPGSAAAQGAVTVARYSFDGGVTATGTIADQAGRGPALRVRGVRGGTVRFEAHGNGRAAVFPQPCANDATCPRAILEGADDPDLDPGTREFAYGASVRITAAQVRSGANVMQKGVAGTESQWKLQIGRKGVAQCAVSGRGSNRIYMVKSDTSVADGAWRRAACRRTANALIVYVDGRVENSVALPSDLSLANAMPLRLGGRNLNGRSDQFAGAMDDVYAILG